jgi:hypothetical protein
MEKCPAGKSTFPDSWDHASGCADSRSVVRLSIRRILMEILSPYTFPKQAKKCTRGCTAGVLESVESEKCPAGKSTFPDSWDYASGCADSRSVVRLSIRRILIEILSLYTFAKKCTRGCTAGVLESEKCPAGKSTFPDSWDYASGCADSRSSVRLSVR